MVAVSSMRVGGPVAPRTLAATAETISDVQSLYQSLLYEYDYEVEQAWGKRGPGFSSDGRPQRWAALLEAGRGSLWLGRPGAGRAHVEGTIPSDLVGTYVRNGPGLQVNSGKTKRHTFDGDGMLLQFTFPGGEGGRVRFKNKFVRTKGFLEEQAAGRPTLRTAFTRGSVDGNPFFNPFDFNLKNCANTGVLAWAGKLLALYESGLPHELDPRTLETVGESTVGGQLETPVLAAHYRVAPRRGGDGNGDGGGVRDWVAFSANTGLSGTELIFYEFEEGSGKLRHSPTRAVLPGTRMALVHDIAVTQDYYVAHVGPLEFSGAKFVTEYFTSRCSIAECLQYTPDKPSKIWLVPRPTGTAAGQEPRVIEAPATFVFHHANAFQSTTQDGRQTLTL
ncbi:lignostilbene-alpha,beta-dioxygenase [Monoraphidium neglectum]|uniref:Lignostilbene-alpha,beta-dioxygenase n=1 Tax=Monoraphidium neglectum TaxID=145388 RepID=A0A0D2LW16_9CHLO|nr:lignostilbene-alpha,beta-dioxygenase [Monoraphidium neglectum]KIY95659.1 lignostilbene-alpha,beta-dioxygenase [Monoraphidium neglectum]|eukprot:XP_013894679.1 lignostilbene-alpha,beta-dioxygenase [Monoraphidium neglectum]